MVTAFTVAHSMTLALSVLGIATLPSQLVEPVIALSIAYVAFENLTMKRARCRGAGRSAPVRTGALALALPAPSPRLGCRPAGWPRR